MNRLICNTPAFATSPFDRLLDRAFSGTAPVPVPRLFRETVEETPEAFILRIDLPGFGKEDVRAEVKDRTLSLEAKADESRPFQGRISRAWKLGPEIDAAGIRAKLDLGILELTVPKKAPAEPETRTLEIQ